MTVARSQNNNVHYSTKVPIEYKRYKGEKTMKNNSAAKWIILSTAVTAVAAFAAGVAYELHAIKKLTVDIDEDEEPVAPAAEEAESATEETEAVEETEVAEEDTAAEETEEA